MRVLVVDDSAVTRAFLINQLKRAQGIEVVGEAGDPYQAREQILRLAPDVVTLDIEMPRMDGLTFLSRLMRYHPLPVVVISSLTPANSEVALRALALGAVEVVAKPKPGESAAAMRSALVRALHAAAAANVGAAIDDDAAEHTGAHTPTSHNNIPKRARRLIVIGASTGGPTAIERILTALPPNTPPILVVQHMPAGFTSSFARRLNECCALTVREARDGERLERGTALIAPSGQHTLLLQGEGELRVAVRAGPPVHHHRPAVDVLFHSVAQTLGGDVVGVLLTGMGADGASGMSALHTAGAHTIAQDEATSVVFSMPREAIELGGASEVLPLPRIASAITNAVSARQPAALRSAQ